MRLNRMTTEPHQLRRWRLPFMAEDCRFYTCARPGRSLGLKSKVADELIHKWVRRFLWYDKLVIISLLGQKPEGLSEWSFYSFYEHGLRFGDWLAQHYPGRGIQVVEHPTIDRQPVPRGIKEAVKASITDYLNEGYVVVLIDSGGETRTGDICRFMDATRVR